MKSLGIGLIGLFAFTLNAWSGTPALEGIVKDTNGRPIKGAEVRIEARTGKFSNAMKTDANGHYRFDGLTGGIDYKVTLLVNGTIKGQILNGAARAGKSTELNFDLRTTKGYVGKRRIWVPESTGTHIGGGRWVILDDNGNVVNDDSSVSRVGQSDVKQMQMGGANKAKVGGGQ
jgi:hypothetical protein